MEYRRLGRSGLEVSTLCLGTMTFGEANAQSFMHQVGCDDETAFQIMDKAIESGINFFDTADVYGQDGLSERIIGHWFEKQGRRDDVVLATKCRFRMTEGANGSGASRRRIVRAVEDSLRRLKTDRIDLYQIHMQDVDTPEEETLRALDDLIRQGKILYIGCSNYAAYRLTESLFTAEKRNLTRFISHQAQYSLMVRNLEREHVPACDKFGVSHLAWSPLSGGFLSGKYKQGTEPAEGTRLKKWQERYTAFDKPKNWRILEALEAVSKDVDASCAQVALAWLLKKKTVASVIFGARSVDQLDDNLKAADLKLGDAHMQALNEASSYDVGYPYDFITRIQGRW